MHNCEKQFDDPNKFQFATSAEREIAITGCQELVGQSASLQKVMDQILKALKEETRRPAADSATTAPAADPAKAAPSPILPLTPEGSTAGPADHLSFRRLVLPEGDKFEYVCSRCSATCGTKIERPPPVGYRI